ncbi:hypothetical protein GQ44DRAFT_442525 [Phaeosphaeriaceae sp. PMI808]|nr:hypothetical protein GQ44DRAFT_442525 [Phaeosphaeriaceae sp. PMI808]
MESAPGVEFHGGRMLIPIARQNRPRPTPISVGKRRARKACTPCRERKIKCDEGQPECTYCVGYGRHCVYKDSRRDRLSDLVAQKQLLVDLVLRLRLTATVSNRKDIEDTLDEVSWASIHVQW